MKAQAFISGSLIWEGVLDCIPPVGTSIIFKMQAYKKGLRPGTIVRFDVTADLPPTIDLTENPPVVIFDVDSLQVLDEGPTTPDEAR